MPDKDSMTSLNSIIKLIACFAIIVSCTRVENIQSGSEAFEKEQYYLATQMLQKELNGAKNNKEKADILHKISISQLHLNKLELAYSSAERSSKLYSNGKAEKLMADLLKGDKKYVEAQKMYKEAGIALGNPFEYRKEILSTRTIAEWSTRAARSRLTKLETCTNNNEYSIDKYEDNQVLISSDQASLGNDEKYSQTNKYFHNIYVVENSDLSSISNSINTENNEGTPSYNSVNKTIIFTRCNTDKKNLNTECKLFSSKIVAGNWMPAKRLNFCQEGTQYLHPSLSKDGTQLLFASNAKEGYGGFDIYKSTLLDSEIWDEPILLTRVINTPGDEKFPFQVEDTVYFSSNYHTGFGKLDIYKTYQVGNNRWTQALNLMPPINSAYDDFGYKQWLNEEKELELYMCSSREGNDNIYKIGKVQTPQEEIILTKPRIFINIRLFIQDSKEENREPCYDCNISLSKNDKLIVKNKNSTKISSEYQLVERSLFDLKVSKLGYFSQTKLVSTEEILLTLGASDIYLEQSITLQKIDSSKEIVLENIYYDFDQSNIRPDAEPSLLVLKKIMNDNPGIKIELSSHTDCRGIDTYNMALSQRRAQSAKEFLIAQGISQNRIHAKGYGESKLISTCNCKRCSDEEYQIDRRTSFRVIENNQ